MAHKFLSRAEVLDLMRRGYWALTFDSHHRQGSKLYHPDDMTGPSPGNVHANTLRSLAARSEIAISHRTTLLIGRYHYPYGATVFRANP